MLAGGLLIQLLPGADDTVIDKLEKNIAELEPVTTMLAKGMSILDICKTALKGFEVEVLDENPVKYVCGCSKEKLEKLALKAFGSKYDETAIAKWLGVFTKRFFISQFKRSCIPDSPKVGSVSLSPRGDWRMPSDASFNMFI